MKTAASCNYLQFGSRERKMTAVVTVMTQEIGCGAVGRAVAYNTRGPGFEFSHRQLLLNIYLLLTVCRKDKNKEKGAGNGPFLKRDWPQVLDAPFFTVRSRR